jgi:hypothetical protein
MKVVMYDIETLKEYFLVVALVPQEPYRVFKVNKKSPAFPYIIRRVNLIIIPENIVLSHSFKI